MADAQKEGARHKQRFEFAGVFADPDDNDAVDKGPLWSRVDEQSLRRGVLGPLRAGQRQPAVEAAGG
eukprot:4298058-Alexandrium_andersonii.AAC.1